MMRPVRLYLAGPAGSGKTTVAEMLVREYGFARVSMGGLCREEARRMGLPEDRATLQAMGTCCAARNRPGWRSSRGSKHGGHRGRA